MEQFIVNALLLLPLLGFGFGRPLSMAASPTAEGTSPTFYLDAGLLMDYWSGPRGYHHTASSNLYYALHEAARLVLVEGLAARWERHARLGAELAAGLQALGLELGVEPAARLPQLTVVRIPEGVDDARVRRELLERYGIEIGGGLGDFKGKVWRIGLMGSGASPRNVALVLAALGGVLGR